MARRIRVLLALASLLVLGLAIAPSVAAGDPCYHGYTIPPATTDATSTVRMELCAFLPTNAEVAPGTTVTFTNDSDMAHLLTGANQAWGDRDKELAPGDSVSVTFDKPGVYAFSCAFHRGMSGSVIVGDPGSAAGAGSLAGSSDGAGGAGQAALVIALGALAVAGWGIVLAQRRRGPGLVDALTSRQTPAI